MRRFVVLISICMLLLLPGCGSQATANSSSNAPVQDKTLTIGTMPDIDSLPLLIAQEKGFFALHLLLCGI